MRNQISEAAPEKTISHRAPAGTKTLRGTLRSFNFSPKGGIEGLILEIDEAMAQVTVEPEFGGILVKMLQLGKAVELTVKPEGAGHRDDKKSHDVFRLVGVRDAKGQSVELEGFTGKKAKIEGEVERLNYARHGEANGVVLTSGDFVHMKPHGMNRLPLQVGDKVIAEGQEHPTILGTRVIEAEKVNGKSLDKKKTHH
jgi:hypothetical protein